MTFETQFEIGQMVRATRNNYYVDFEVAEIRIQTLAQGHLTLTEYRSVALSSKKAGTWYAEKEITAL